MNDNIGKEQIELLVSQHYMNARDFLWSSDKLSFSHDGIKSQVDTQQLTYENEQLKHQIDYVQGGRDALMQVMAAQGQMVMPTEQNTMSLDEFIKMAGQDQTDVSEIPPEDKDKLGEEPNAL